MATVDDADARDERIGRILNEFLDQRLRGQSPSEQALLEQHPDLADELRAQLNALRHLPTTTGNLHNEAPTLVDSGAPPVEAIAGYTLIKELHRGGQGVVYQAIQKATKSTVAVKVMLEGPFASDAARYRFDREVELAASLKHPNIVTIHDSGVCDGRHFFVMDYIRGQAPTDYVSSKKTAIDETLRLFAKICDAIDHAHRRGVIHRDLKPSNILVDANGEPHILDFGLAKTAGSRVVGESRPMLLSMTGQVIGTLAYMSPEQAQGDPEAVDIRSDVYSLGLILYEMLTAGHPYQVDGQVTDVLRNIVETPPTLPSKAWKTGSGVSLVKQTKFLSRVRCPIDNEVETIVLKCLQKERERRYQSAGELARDIRHYLDGEPIEAKRDSASYVLRKILHRYRRPTGVAAVIVVLVAAGLIAMARQRARVRLVDAQRQAVEERARAEKVMASFVHAPERAISEAEGADANVKDQLVKLNRASLVSAAFTERIAGARSGLIIAPDAFWKSIDGGELWSQGEWLELCRVEWSSADRARVLEQSKAKAVGGTDRQKYVALCLIGRLASDPQRPVDAPVRAELADLCVKAARAEESPGVVSAARWAAMRLGRTVDYVATSRPTAQYSPPIFPDDAAGMTFVLVPPCEAFRRGSDAGERDRFRDEDKPAQGMPIKPFYLGTTEVTVAAFAMFLKDAASADGTFADATASDAEDERDPRRSAAEAAAFRAMLAMSPGQAAQRAAGSISLEVARRYCRWLNSRAGKNAPARSYRLPTEEEWEWACRAGHTARFCYGDDADYLRYFANCNGDEESHSVGQRMPNWYGLFDMHGGLWEWCDSAYPPELAKARVVALDVKRAADLDRAAFPQDLRDELARRDAVLPAQARVSIEEPGRRWVVGGKHLGYLVLKEPADGHEVLSVYTWHRLFVERGGAFYSPAVRCRSAQRNRAPANWVDFYTGFRLVMEWAGS